jgi:BlaR1 peptidase M56
MSGALMCFLVAAAAYSLTSLTLALAVAALSPWIGARRLAAGELLTLRLLPGLGALVLVAAVVLPAFLTYEPSVRSETGGPLLWGLAGLALVMAGDALRRALSAHRATQALLRRCGPARRHILRGGRSVAVVELAEPLVAVIGAWRGRIIAARRVVSECGAEELEQIVAHECAHLASHDNLKYLLLIVSPDFLAWLPSGSALARRWRICAECEADQRATGSDPHKRLALASALIRVARLHRGPLAAVPAMSGAADEVESRVRRLLAPAAAGRRGLHAAWLLAGALLITVAALPAQRPIYGLVEFLVGFGR